MEANVPEMPDYPIPNTLSSSLRKEAAKQGVAAYLSMWCGQGVSGIRENLTTEKLLQQLRLEFQAVVGDLNL